MEPMIASLRESLAAISAPRFFESERGFQGELLVQLSKRLKLSDNTIIEQEHQKKLKAHGLTIRPDIIIHEPFNPELHEARTEGNFAAIELKLNASPESAAADFNSLAAMLEVLQYPIGFFVNIGSATTHCNLVPDSARGKIVCFAVHVAEGETVVVEERT
jgi:hypothetical protein